MSISDTTVKRIVDAGERADDMVRNTARTVQEMDPTPFGRALGWFSIGLGLAEALAPKTMAKAIGAEGYEGVVCAFGLREIATGIGILSGERPAAGWLWRGSAAMHSTSPSSAWLPPATATMAAGSPLRQPRSAASRWPTCFAHSG
jgi:hypothetical protein